MNPKSKFKEKLTNMSLSKDKKFIFKNESIYEDDKLESRYTLKNTKVFLSDSNQINYHLDNLKEKINVEKEDIIHICLFSIQTKSKYPYLLYLLYKHENILTFPYYIYDEDNDILESSNKNISKIIDIDYNFKGYLKEKKNIYMFYQLDNNTYDTSFIKSEDRWWFALPYEICYLKSLLYYNIHESVYNIFLNNQFLLYLCDNKNIYHEIPICLYLGSNKEKINFLKLFSADKNTAAKSNQGQFYYYYSYDLACRYGLWNREFKNDKKYTDNNFGRYKNGSILRYAVFIGKSKVNNIDIGDDIVVNYKNIKDNEGNWSLDYDSVFINNEILSNEKQIGYTYVIKNNDQVDLLSYHDLDKTGVDEMYNIKKKYEII